MDYFIGLITVFVLFVLILWLLYVYLVFFAKLFMLNILCDIIRDVADENVHDKLSM